MQGEGHFPQKSPIIRVSFAKNDLQLKERGLKAHEPLSGDLELSRMAPRGRVQTLTQRT